MMAPTTRVLTGLTNDLSAAAAVISATFRGVPEGASPGDLSFDRLLLGWSRFTFFMILMVAKRLLAGLFLVWSEASSLGTGWIASGPGITYAAGVTIGLAACLVALLMIRPRALRLSSLGKVGATAGGHHDPEQKLQLQRLGLELTVIGRLNFILLALAVLSVAASRYSWS